MVGGVHPHPSPPPKGEGILLGAGDLRDGAAWVGGRVGLGCMGGCWVVSGMVGLVAGGYWGVRVWWVWAVVVIWGQFQGIGRIWIWRQGSDWSW